MTNPPATGAAALADPLSATVESVSVQIGGEPMNVVFSGLVPSFAGLYQVDVELGDAPPSGNAVLLVIQVAGIDSNTTFIAVEEAETTPTVEVAP